MPGRVYIVFTVSIKQLKFNTWLCFSQTMQVLGELLPMLYREGHRVLIFSQWTSMLDILEWTLDIIGVTYSRLDGR